MCGAYGRLGTLSRRLLLGLSGSVCLAALTTPAAVLAQQETTLPEVRVIATTPVPSRPRPARRTTARPAAAAPVPSEPAREPTGPGLIDRDKVPSNTQTLTPVDLDSSKVQSVPDALMRTVPGV